MTAGPERVTETESQAFVDWVDSDHHRELERGAADADADEQDAWFRAVADPGEVIERDRRIAEAERDAGDAFDSGDLARMNTLISQRERAFWALPPDKQARPDADVAAATFEASTDDDADGW